MREIKFRAWDKLEEKFLAWQEIIDFCDFSWIFAETDGVANFGTNSFIPEQFTGLLDKNGVEVYENDKIVIAKEDDEEVFIVQYDNDTARFILAGSTYVVDFDNYYGKDCEVIGNIHESEEKYDS